MTRPALTLSSLSLAAVVVSMAFAGPAAAAECAPGARADDARIQLWKEPGCRGAWVEVAFREDGDRPDFRRFAHSDGDAYDVDDNRASGALARGTCVRLFSHSGYRGSATRLRCARRGDLTFALPEGVSSMRACPVGAATLCRRRATAPERSPRVSDPAAPRPGGMRRVPLPRSIESFEFDRPGRYPQNCTGRLLPGTAALARLIDRRWRTGRARLGYTCVESRPGVVDVHGEGRAIDWSLDARSPHDRAIADALVQWLLADDHHGNRHARARRLGVQEIAWNGRVWTSSRWRAGLRPIRTGERRRRWVHIALTHDGARGLSSFWH